MRANKKFLATAASAFVLASPATALAQSAGDQQYSDPLANHNSGQTQKKSSGSDNTGTQGNTNKGGNQVADAGTTATPSPDPVATTAQSGAKQLPRTGLEVVMFVATGFVLLLTGLVMHRLVARPVVRRTFR